MQETHSLDMLLTLLFLTQVSGEWVEISQQHYQKPMRPTHNYPSLTTVSKVSEPERATRPNRIYINQSLPENNWNKGTAYSVPRDVSVKRKIVSSTVLPLLENKTKSAFETTVRKEAFIHGDIDNGPINIPKSKVKNYQIKNEGKLKDAGFYPKLSHTASMRRIYFTSTEIPPLRIKPEKYDDRPIEVLNLSDLEYVTEDDGFTTVEVDEGFNLDYKDDRRTSNTAVIPKVILKDKCDRNRLFVIRTDEKIKKTDFENCAPDSELKNRGNVPTEENVEYNNRNVAITGSNIKRVQMTKGITEKTTAIREHVKKHDEPSKLTSVSKSAVKREEIFKDGKGLGKSVYKFPIVGKVQRVELVNSTAKPLNRTSAVHQRYENYRPTNATAIKLPEQIKGNAYRDSQSKIEETVQMAFNKGKIDDRIEIGYAATAKTDTSELKNKESIKRLTVPNPEDVMIEELLMIDEEQSQGTIHKSNYNGIVKKVQPTSSTEEITIKNDIFNKNRPKNNGQVILPHPEFVTEDQTFINDEELDSHIYKITNDEQVERLKAASEDIPLLTTVDVKPKKNILENIPTTNDDNNSYKYNSFGTITADNEALHNPKPKFTTKEYVHKITNFENFVTSTQASGEGKLENNEILTKLPHADHSENINLSNKGNSKQNKIDFKQETKSEVKFNYTKENTMENVVRLIKVVADTISRNTQKNFNSKMRYLEELKDAILANIEDRLESEFPDDPSGPRRSTRAAPESRGHVEIPSSESALMTISFLTFAVFLIKLVLQLIQTYKNKTMMMPAVVAAVGRSASAFREYRSHN